MGVVFLSNDLDHGSPSFLAGFPESSLELQETLQVALNRPCLMGFPSAKTSYFMPFLGELYLNALLKSDETGPTW